MRAVVIVTLCRRYHELRANLPRLLGRAMREWGRKPDVILVWARPEVGRLWLVRDLLADGMITHVVSRLAIPGEADGRATTRPESLNLRLGLEFARERYPGHLALCTAADVWAHEGTLAQIKRELESGHRAVLYHWENACGGAAWHTNFFAVPLEEGYWPPVSPESEHDVLERQWGKKIERLKSGGIFFWHNSGRKRFLHRHQSEALPPAGSLCEREASSLPLCVSGWRPWYERVLRGVGRFWERKRGF